MMKKYIELKKKIEEMEKSIYSLPQVKGWMSSFKSKGVSEWYSHSIVEHDGKLFVEVQEHEYGEETYTFFFSLEKMEEVDL